MLHLKPVLHFVPWSQADLDGISASAEEYVEAANNRGAYQRAHVAGALLRQGWQIDLYASKQRVTTRKHSDHEVRIAHGTDQVAHSLSLNKNLKFAREPPALDPDMEEGFELFMRLDRVSQGAAGQLYLNTYFRPGDNPCKFGAAHQWHPRFEGYLALFPETARASDMRGPWYFDGAVTCRAYLMVLTSPARRRWNRLAQMVRARAVAIYWLGLTQVSQCAPGGAGRRADAAAYAEDGFA
jgi:hypothetical protein